MPERQSERVGGTFDPTIANRLEKVRTERPDEWDAVVEAVFDDDLRPVLRRLYHADTIELHNAETDAGEACCERLAAVDVVDRTAGTVRLKRSDVVADVFALYRRMSTV